MPRTPPLQHIERTLGDNARNDADGYLTPQFIIKASTSIVTGRKEVAAAGTAVRLVAIATPCQYVIVCAGLGNTNPIVIGDSAVVAANATQQGIVLVPGNNPIRIDIDDVYKLYVDSITNNDAVSFAYLPI